MEKFREKLGKLMCQKRVMRGFLTSLVIILSLQIPWMKAIKNESGDSIEGHITNEEINIIQIQLNQTFGGLERDFGSSVIQTVDGGFLIAGSTDSYSSKENLDMWLVKTNTSGYVEWNQTYDLSLYDLVSDLIQTIDQNFLLIGSCFDGCAPCLDWGSALKLFANGTVEWCQFYQYGERGGAWVDSDEHCLVHAVVQTTDGGFLFAGETVDYLVGDTGPNNMDMWLVKTDDNGSVEWNQIYGSRDDGGYSVIQTTDEGFLIAGVTIDYHYVVDNDSRVFIYPHNADMWLVKLYANGSVEWDQAYGGTGSDYAFNVIQTVDGGFLLAGVTNYWSNNSDMWLVKTDANGSEEWDQTYGGSGHDHASSVLQTADGGFLIVGDTESYGAGEEDIWLVKTYSNGTIKWNQTFGGSERDRGKSVIQTADSEFLVVGSTESFGAGDSDIWLLKLSESIETTTELMSKTSPTSTVPTNPSESKDSSILGFEIFSLFVGLLLIVIIQKQRK
ncbi:MAG: hypothetical protein ACFFB5_20660 [Promethearchaeota archaeon]